MTKNLLSIGLVLSVLIINCFAQDLPKTPAGKRAKEVIELLNGTSSSKPGDYIGTQYAPEFRDAFPIEAHQGMIQRTQAMFGKCKVVDITKSTQHEISLVLKSEIKDAWLNLLVQVEPEDAHRIAAIGFRPGSRPADSKKDKTTLFSNLDELNKYLQQKTEESQFSGTVLIAQAGNPVFQQAYGYASKKLKIPNNLDTKFNLGSVNKIFTSIAITQLMEKGKLSFEDPIGKYLDIFPREIANKVTIRHLLDMKSGWGDYWINEYYLAHKDELLTVSDYMAFIKDIPLEFEPGTKFQHCNTGYEVAGAIIEKISGTDYFDYIKKNIYTVSGMAHSDSYYRDVPVENLATGYTNVQQDDQTSEAYQADNLDMLPPRGTPAGGGYSTVGDLLKFTNALRDNKLLNSQYSQYVINRFKGSPDDPYTPPLKTFRILGRAPGITSFLGIDFQSSYTIIVLSNYDTPVTVDVAEEIIKMLNLK